MITITGKIFQPLNKATSKQFIYKDIAYTMGDLVSGVWTVWLWKWKEILWILSSFDINFGPEIIIQWTKWILYSIDISTIKKMV